MNLAVEPAPIRIATPRGEMIAADVLGPAEAPAVILGHGGGQTRHSWARATRELAAAGYHVVNYDLLGHGESEWAADGDYSLARRADDLKAIAATLERPFALVGASLGGLTALAAARAGIGPRAIVLVDIVPQMDRAGAERVHRFMTARPDGFATLDEALDAVAAYNPARPRPADGSGLMKNLRHSPDGRLRWHWDPRLFDGMSGSAEDMASLADDAPGLRDTPLLLVRGLKSDIVSDAGVAHLRERVPALEVAEVAGAGHMVAGDRNDAFNAAVIGFLRRVMPLEPAPSAP